MFENDIFGITKSRGTRRMFLLDILFQEIIIPLRFLFDHCVCGGGDGVPVATMVLGNGGVGDLGSSSTPPL